MSISEKQADPQNCVLMAPMPGDIVVVSLIGRGTFQNCACLKSLFEHYESKGRSVSYVIDFEKCETMDSTFLGMLACMAYSQKRQGKGKPVAVNMSPHVQHLLHTLGLSYLLDMRQEAGSIPTYNRCGAEEAVVPEESSRLEQIIMMIKAHETLIDLDSKNQILFEDVLDCLHRSLEREKQKLSTPAKE